GRCLSYGQALTYWPLVEALRTLGEPAEAALELLVAGGATSQQQLAWNVQQALDQAAKKRPLLVVLEDLHWAEPALLDLLESVTESSVDAPILVLCLARPEILEQRPAWAGTVANVLLGPLAPADSASLLGHLDRPLEDDARERVLRLAAGNPLFLEELSAFVAEGETGEKLPPRIQVLLQARLDLLPEPERLLLATAALEGMVFHRGALEALLPEEQRPDLAARLAALTGKLLLHPTMAQLDRESAFRFRHQLIRDAAYAALPKSDRGRLHEAFADWIEQHGAGRIELEDINAYHLEQAALLKRELGAGEPALERRAVTALAAAAERASRRTDLRAAASLGRRALRLVEEDDPPAPELELELGFMIATLGHFDEAQPLLAHAEQNTRDTAVKAAIQIARLHAALHFAPEGGVTAAIRRECAEAIPLFEQRGDHRWLGRAWHALGDAEWGQLRAQACADAYEQAAAEAELAGDGSLRSRALMQRLACLAHTRVTFTAAVEEAERLSEQLPGEPAIEATAGLIRVLAALNDGRRDEARALAPQFLERFRSAGYPIWAAINTANVGLQQLFSGDVEEAERLVLDGIAELEQLNERLFRGLAKTYLAQIRLAQGRFGEALHLAGEAENDSGPDDRRTAIYAASVRARAHASLGEIERARAAAATAVAIADSTDSLQSHAMAQYSLAETLAAAGDLAAAITAAEEAVRLWTTLDRRPLRRFAAALAEQIEREAVAAPASQTS
ncbi:MAG TPA: hypothetical protein VFL61_09495, partial [Gaiellaceae bacterium]|nr:hypothetical protein [Gaiellaceae bacterium]